MIIHIFLIFLYTNESQEENVLGRYKKEFIIDYCNIAPALSHFLLNVWRIEVQFYSFTFLH